MDDELFICQMFMENPSINPMTGNRLIFGKGPYNKYVALCEKHGYSMTTNNSQLVPVNYNSRRPNDQSDYDQSFESLDDLDYNQPIVQYDYDQSNKLSSEQVNSDLLYDVFNDDSEYDQLFTDSKYDDVTDRLNDEADYGSDYDIDSDIEPDRSTYYRRLSSRNYNETYENATNYDKHYDDTIYDNPIYNRVPIPDSTRESAYRPQEYEVLTYETTNYRTINPDVDN